MLSLTWSSECDQQVDPLRHEALASWFNYTKHNRFNSEPTSKSNQGQQAITFDAHRGPGKIWPTRVYNWVIWRDEKY